MSIAWAVPCVVALVLTQTAVIATSIYLHRALAHRSLHLHPIADMRATSVEHYGRRWKSLDRFRSSISGRCGASSVSSIRVTRCICATIA